METPSFILAKTEQEAEYVADILNDNTRYSHFFRFEKAEKIFENLIEAYARRVENALGTKPAIKALEEFGKPETWDLVREVVEAQGFKARQLNPKQRIVFLPAEIPFLRDEKGNLYPLQAVCMKAEK